MTTFFLILFTILSIISISINVNLLSKLEKLEVDNEEMYKYVSEMELWINQFSHKINESFSRIKNIDRKGAFEADDEVGFIFKDLKNIISDLSKLTTVEDETPAEETKK